MCYDEMVYKSTYFLTSFPRMPSILEEHLLQACGLSHGSSFAMSGRCATLL